MQRKKTDEEIVSEINHYAEKLVYEDKLCRQVQVMFKLTRYHLKKIPKAKSKFCFVEKASVREGVIILNCRYVIGRSIDNGESVATVGEQFEIEVDRYSGLAVARTYRKRFAEHKEFGVIG